MTHYTLQTKHNTLLIKLTHYTLHSTHYTLQVYRGLPPTLQLHNVRTEETYQVRRCQVSGVRCQVSGVRCQESGVSCQVWHVTCHLSTTTTATSIDPLPCKVPHYAQKACL